MVRPFARRSGQTRSGGVVTSSMGSRRCPRVSPNPGLYLADAAEVGRDFGWDVDGPA